MGINKSKFNINMDCLNAGRNDADYYDVGELNNCPVDWGIDDETIGNFILASNNMNLFFGALKSNEGGLNEI